MRSFVVLLAASLVAADRPEGPETAQIGYQVKFLEMSGLGWRSSLYSQLQPVARQGSATVWTSSRETASKLAEKAAEVVAAPRVTSLPQVRSTVFQNRTRKISAEVSREADGPVNHASFVGFVPRIEDATEGYSAEFTGRKLDQGVLATLSLVDRRITAVHSVPLTEVLEAKAGHEGETKTPIEVTIQIPEYARTAVSGEWLIPKEGVLVVSLGVHTVADSQGKAVVHERLAVVEADEAEGPQPSRMENGISSLDLSRLRLNARIGHFGGIALPMSSPVLPSHSLPRSLDATGQPVELPPLPEEKTITMLPGSSEPCASPQARSETVTAGALPWRKSQNRDLEASRTGYGAEPIDPNSVKFFPTSEDFPWANTQASQARAHALASDDKAPAPPCCDSGAYCTEDDSASTDNKAPEAAKPIRFAIPLSATSRIEFTAKITPNPSVPAASPPTPSPSSTIGVRSRPMDSGRTRAKSPRIWNFDD